MIRYSLVKHSRKLAHLRGVIALSPQFATQCTRSPLIHGFATSSNNGEVEYEIDYISLKKTPKISKKPSTVDDIIKLKLTTTPLIDGSVVRKTIEEINNEVDPKVNTFVIAYSTELTEFLKFIAHSYSNKVRRFQQLTTIEVLNSLYIFKDYYLKNKIPAVNKYNVASYNLMLEELLKFLKKNPQFPAILNDVLLINNQGIELLSANFGSYLQELNYLKLRVPFNEYSTKMLHVLKDIDKIIEVHEYTGLEQGEEFFKNLITVKRFQSLKNILQQFPDILPVDLAVLTENNNFVNAAKEIGTSTSKPSPLYLRCVFSDPTLPYSKIIAELYQLKAKKPELEMVYDKLMSTALYSTFNFYEKPMNKRLTIVKISDDIMQNFEFSLIYKHNLFKFVDELKVLNAMGIDLSRKALVEDVNGLKFENDVLEDRFARLSNELEEFFDELILDETKCLYKLIENKNWLDYCLEIFHSRVPKLLVDYSNLSDYPYRSINLHVEFAKCLPILSHFAISNNINLSAFSLDSLLSIFKDDYKVMEDLRKVYLNYGNVYFSNAQELLDDYRSLQYNLKTFNLLNIKAKEGKEFQDFTSQELTKYFGYYLSLIKYPLILDNLEELYKESDSPNDIEDVIQELSNFKYELEVLRVDEFQKYYKDLAAGEVLFKLEKRINEILSNLNSNPYSRLGARNVHSFRELKDILAKYFKLKGEPALLDSYIEYKQVPDNVKIHDLAPELEILKRVLGKNFKDSNQQEIMLVITTVLGRNEEKGVLDIGAMRLSVKLSQLFKENGGHTDVLDAIVDSHSLFAALENKLKKRKENESTPTVDAKPYVQIPEYSNVHEYGHELNLIRNHEFDGSFALATASDILQVLEDRTNEFYNFTLLPDSYVTSENFDDFLKLHRCLLELFKVNGNNSKVLDDIIANDEEFKKFEQRILQKQAGKQYLQIPDELGIHGFAKQLAHTRSSLFDSSKFGSLESSLITQKLEDAVDEALDGKSSFIKQSEIAVYRTLLSKLKRLFAMNGDYTFILDTIINSEGVFNEFEKKKLTKYEYKQLPDDFRLQEFIFEIIDLKAEVSPNGFKGVTPEAIYSTLKFMITNERKYNLTKRLNFKKLLRNLKVLFNYNGGETSVLDNILINYEVLNEMPLKSKKEWSELEEFLRDYQPYFSYFTKFTRLIKYDLVNFYDLTPEEFSIKAELFLAHIKKTSKYEIVAYQDFVERLSALYAKDPLTLPILLRLQDSKIDTNTIETVTREIKEFMDNLAQNIDSFEEPEEIYKRSIEVPIEKFDIKDFKDSKPSSFKYNKDINRFNIKEDSLEDSELFMRNQLIHQMENKDMKDSVEMQELLMLTPEEIRSTYNAEQDRSKKKLEDYLENANKQKKMKEEEEFRQIKAFEWSKIKANSNRSLESKNFFDSSDARQGNVKYLILTINGEKIVSKTNPFGKDHFEDAFSIFDKFNEVELQKFVKNIQRLQRKSWKLIGGGSGNYGKMLVFCKENEGNTKSKVFKKVKSLFAVTGATFIALIGVNYWLDDPESGESDIVPSEALSSEESSEVRNEKEPEPLVIVGSPQAPSEEVLSPKNLKSSGWFWK